MKKLPGVIDTFNGLWVRGTVDDVPPDHLQDCLNVMAGKLDIGSRDATDNYLVIAGIKRMALYKPLPPFTGTNVPRIIALKDNGELHDVLLSPSLLYTNVLMKDFGFVNFFGRCYISPSDGKVGLQGEFIKLYEGGGAAGFRNAAGGPPTVQMTAIRDPVNPGKLDVGTYYLSYAFETSSGFITQPILPFIFVDSFGTAQINITNIPIGPIGTKARWIISTKAETFRANLGIPPDVGKAIFLPLFFAARIGDNISTTYNLSFYDEGLVEDASFLLTQLTVIPAGVGLIDYKGRMVSYGAYDDPSLVRISEIGEPEAFSATSGFLITDPSDSTGVRCATEFRNTLYIFKQQRGYMTEDNTLEPSTWQVINFDKSIGTEQYGIAAVLDAKGSSSDGFLVADAAGLYYFNGVFVEPELSYKIRDYWLRISQQYFYLTQVSLDPINKRIYILIALDNATSVSHMIMGDYRNGLNPQQIKWWIWQLADGMSSILTYTDFTNDIPLLVSRISTPTKIISLRIDQPGNDSGAAVDSFFETSMIRFSPGVSQFNRLRLSARGPATLAIVAYAKDKSFSKNLASIMTTSAPGKEYANLMNLVNEQCSIKVRCNAIDEKFSINMLQLEGLPYADERPR